MFNTDKDNVYLLQKQYILSELTKNERNIMELTCNSPERETMLNIFFRGKLYLLKTRILVA